MPHVDGSVTIEFQYPFPEERVFRYQAMQDVLSVLIDEPFQEYSVGELATTTGNTQSSISRSIDLLCQVGAVETQRNGRKQVVRINRDRLDKPDPILAVPQSEFQKPLRAFVDEVERVVEELVGIVLFGSVARGEADRASDIDVLVVVGSDKTKARRDVQSVVRELEETKFDDDRYSFQALVESEESARRVGDRLREQFDEGITLVGSAELREIKAEVYGDGE